MIIKVKLVAADNPNMRECLMHDKDLSISYQGEIPEGLLPMMKGDEVAWFEATIVGGMIRVDCRVGEQGW